MHTASLAGAKWMAFNPAIAELIFVTPSAEPLFLPMFASAALPSPATAQLHRMVKNK
jgi:hypothetical protein